MVKKLALIFCLSLIGFSVFAESGREYFKFAKFSYDTEDYSRALNFINQAINVDPGYVNGYLLRAQISFRIAEYSQVIEDISTAFSLDQNIERTMPEFHLLRGDAYIKMEDINSAVNDISISLRLDPGNARAHFLMGMINCNKKIYFEALENFDKAITLDSDNSEYYYERAKLKKLHFKPLPETKVYESVLIDIKLAVALDPYDFRPYLLKCKMLKLDEKYDKEVFVSELNDMIEKFPDQAAFYSERGMLKVLMNKSKEAISDFTKAIYLDSDNEDNYRNRGLCFHNMQKYQLALNDYSKSIDLLVKKLEPTQYSNATKKALAESFNMRGMSNQLNGDSDLACDDYYNAAKLGSKAGLNNYRKNCNVFN